ncbi:MAG: hypothetical protein CBC24_03275 [Candidatus Pelagibacter sp. TMED64]|nr:hypothetical protein [Candidatus Pelagibacter sp.]OUU66363.1 MAG: hypothetical protein CBC24_03275 [Candidatus Pelagibacter sp. TMED64]
MENKLVFGTGTIRSGGSLVANILSTHKKILITTDFIKFFRHIFKKYDPISNKKNQFLLVEELALRLKYRKNIEIDKKLIFENLSHSKVKNYYDVHKVLAHYFLKKVENKDLFGEYENSEWRNIKTILESNKNYKAFQLIRDPRAIIASWKKIISFGKGYLYLNYIFNWIDSINYYYIYNKKYSTNRYIAIKFEDIHNQPLKTAKRLCKFSNVKFDVNMISTHKWKKILNNPFLYINFSAHSDIKKKIYGFSKKRINNWKKSLDDWEVALINHLTQKQLINLGYEVETYSKSILQKGIDILNKNKLLKKNYEIYIKSGKGINSGLNDPSLAKNWSSLKNPKKKFIDTKEYAAFNKDLKKIIKKSKNII